MMKKNLIVNSLALIFLLFSSLVVAQNDTQIASQEIAERNYRMQESKGAYETAVTGMKNSAARSSTAEVNQLNDDFEFNFAAKAKIESKIKSIQQKRVELEGKFSQAKSAEQKDDFQKKLEQLDLDLAKLNSKLAENEVGLKALQETYRKLNK